ncbi:hypothetical protein DVH24_006356 [Malus domestica]|uniref:MATH domain-containing protein n=1 Tax=Malus domestica TaxID=3750 RepID=A0A498K9Z5_MALDO|nr:hypothetical protein DVH24_006356 [Malus domestica]
MLELDSARGCGKVGLRKMEVVALFFQRGEKPDLGMRMNSKKAGEEIVSETFTWLIENFSKLQTGKHYSDVFTIAGFKWRLLIWPKGNKVKSEMQFSLSAHFSLSVVNQLDSTKTISKATKGISFTLHESCFCSFCVILSLWQAKLLKWNFNPASVFMKSKNKEEEEVSGTFTWVIENFSKLKNENHYSDVFTIAGFKWRILARPKGNEVNSEMHFSMYLCVPSASTLEPGWTKFAHFSLSVLNQLDSNKTITMATKGSYKEFKEHSSEWGFKSFMLLSELYDKTAGYLVNDKCIVEVKVRIPIDQRANGFAESALMEPIKKERGGQEPSHVHSVHTPESSPTPKTPSSELPTPFQETSGPEQVCTKAIVESLPDPSLVKELEEIPTKPTGELLEFRGLGLIEKAFVPLLEEACSLHPSLIECVRKKNRKVVECALTALGGLLHFLKTTKVKDMNGDAFTHLRSLWEDVEMFRFDLAWLEPHVQSALGMKKFLERARRVKRLREDVEALDNEKKRRSAALAVTEAELEEAKRELAKEEEGFNEKDMDSELGCDQTIGS